MSQQMVISRFGGPEVLRIVEAPVPEPAAGELLIRNKVVGISFNEVMQREGTYINPEVNALRPPFAPGYEVAGVVAGVGPGVGREWLGRAVVALVPHGGYAEHVTAPVRSCAAVPAGADLAEAVALPLNYMTAYQMMHRVAKVQPGERVLIHAASGGVGTALLQLGRILGAEMFATASRAKHAALGAYGGRLIDYRTEDFVAEVRRATGRGVHAAFDCLGGAHALRSYRALQRPGRLVLFGDMAKMAAGRPTWRTTLGSYAGIARAMLKNALPWRRGWVRFYGILQTQKASPAWFADDLAALVEHWVGGRLTPRVHDRVPFADIPRAHERLARGEVIGKLVATLPD